MKIWDRRWALWGGGFPFSFFFFFFVYYFFSFMFLTTMHDGLYIIIMMSNGEL